MEPFQRFNKTHHDVLVPPSTDKKQRKKCNPFSPNNYPNGKWRRDSPFGEKRAETACNSGSRKEAPTDRGVASSVAPSSSFLASRRPDRFLLLLQWTHKAKLRACLSLKCRARSLSLLPFSSFFSAVPKGFSASPAPSAAAAFLCGMQLFFLFLSFSAEGALQQFSSPTPGGAVVGARHGRSCLDNGGMGRKGSYAV